MSLTSEQAIFSVRLVALHFAGPPTSSPPPLRPGPDRAARRAAAEDAGQRFWASSIGTKAVMAATGLQILLCGSASAACSRRLPRPPGSTPVAIKGFLASGMLLVDGAAVGIAR